MDMNSFVQIITQSKLVDSLLTRIEVKKAFVESQMKDILPVEHFKNTSNTIKLNHSIPGLSISDFLIIIQWLNYAKIIGDMTYKKINFDFFRSKFIDHQLLNQVEFRKKEFNNN